MANLCTYDNLIKFTIEIYDDEDNLENLKYIQEHLGELTQEQIYNYLIKEKNATQSIEDIENESQKFFNFYQGMKIDLDKSRLEVGDFCLVINVEYIDEVTYEEQQGYPDTMWEPGIPWEWKLLNFTSDDNLNEYMNHILKLLNVPDTVCLDSEHWSLGLNDEELIHQILENKDNYEPDEDMYRYDDY